MANTFVNKKVDLKTLNHLEDFLIESDVGVVAAKELKQIFSNAKIDPKEDSLNQINLIVENYIKNLMLPLEKKIVVEESIKPKVILIAGVNGVGKTTTIGKLGKIFSKNNKQYIHCFSDSEMFNQVFGKFILKKNKTYYKQKPYKEFYSYFREPTKNYWLA